MRFTRHLYGTCAIDNPGLRGEIGPRGVKGTLHLVGLPWTETTRDYLTCAYTQKLLKACGMFRQQGYEVILYAGENNEADADEHVAIVSRQERERWFGEWNRADAFSRITWDPSAAPWAVMNGRAVAEISKRRQFHDLLLLLTTSQAPIMQAMPDLTAAEWAVGYAGAGCTQFRCFESYAWMHHCYGMEDLGRLGNVDGRFYDAVIPNFFDPDDFHVAPKDDYLLFVGRLTSRKGPHVAAQIANELGRRLIVAGPGALEVSPDGHRVVADGCVIEGPHVDYVGPVGAEDRADLMAGATCLLAPTLYIEPFGGVAVEAMLSGTPVVASDFGAFTETVQEGVSGYRFRTLAEGCEAVERAEQLDTLIVRDYAQDRYSLDTVGRQFGRWFQQLDGLWAEGWASPPHHT